MRYHDRLHTFPAPLWPSKAVICPEYMVRSSPSTASLEPPVAFLYSFLRPVEMAHVCVKRGAFPRRAEFQLVDVREKGELNTAGYHTILRCRQLD